MNADPSDAPIVRHFRQRLLWPLHLVRATSGDADEPFWCLLERDPGAAAWRRLACEIGAEATELQERHYKEFVAFLPHVQRFLYGEARGHNTHAALDTPGDSARRVYRRDDVAALRVWLHPEEDALTLSVRHIDLSFFDNVDLALLSVEVLTDNLPLAQARELLYRHGRAYPTGWSEQGQGVNSALRVEWLGHDDQVLAASDLYDRGRYLAFTRTHRAPATASHWAFLLQPLVLDAGAEEGLIRYRQIAYQRMPQMAYLALDDPRGLSHEDWIRLGLVATLRPGDPLPVGDPDVTEFTSRYCYDRFWTNTDAGPNTRFLCSGRALIVVGEAGAPYFVDKERGILGQFRHQYFILFLINHFHRAALLIFSDRLVDAIHDLDIRRPESVRRFRGRVRTCFESFLHFTHRYWFHELSERPHLQALSRLCAGHLGNDALYGEVKEELRDMSQYLDSDASRRANNTFVRLTVITVFSIVGTVATGILGMNIFDLTGHSALARLAYVCAALAGVATIMTFAVINSRKLSDMMDVLSNDAQPLGHRLRELFQHRRHEEHER